MRETPEDPATYVPAVPLRLSRGASDGECAFRVHAMRKAFLLAGCCALLVGTATAAEWYGIKVADAAPKKSVESEAVGQAADKKDVSVAGGETVQAVWDAFLNALRTGQMRSAYALLAPASREEVNYRDFCADWHPLSLKYEEVLSPPGFSEFRISGDLAVLRLGLRQPPRGTEVAGGEPAPVYGAKGDFLRAVLVRENGRWWVLEGKNINKAVAEASARNVLTRLVRDSAIVREALQSGGTVTLTDLRRQMPRFFEETATNEFLRNYQLEIDALRDCVVRARPQRTGLRGYSLGLGGALTVLPPESRVPLAALPVPPAQAPVVPAKKSATPANSAVPVTRAGGTAARSAPVAQEQTASAFFKAPGGTVLPPPPPSFGDPDKSAGARASMSGSSVAPAVPAAPLMPPASAAPGSVPVRSPDSEDDFALPEFEEMPKKVGVSAQLPLAVPAREQTRSLMAAPAGGVPVAGGIRNVEDYEMPDIVAEGTQMPAEVDIPPAEGFSSPPMTVPVMRKADAAARTAPPKKEEDQQELNGLLDRLIDGDGK